MPDAGAWQELLGQEAPPRLTLVLGGARSGKSRLAERLTRAALTVGQTPVYIATAQAWDDEMHARIAKHQSDRGADWNTLEAPHDLPEVIGQAEAVPLLVDCLTLWLSNRMLAESDIDRESGELLASLGRRTAPTVLVSNETGLGIVPETPLGRRFRDAQGTLNHQVAAAAECVVFTAAGLPLVMKRP